MHLIGCDFHTRFQQIAMVDSATGEILNRRLDHGIFNIEGGCYAKAIDLTPELEPDIFQALRFGAVLENVAYDEVDHTVDFRDHSITENTRGAYPIEFIQNARIPCVAGHPTDVPLSTNN